MWQDTNPYSWPYPTHEVRSCPLTPEEGIFFKLALTRTPSFNRSTIACIAYVTCVYCGLQAAESWVHFQKKQLTYWKKIHRTHP